MKKTELKQQKILEIISEFPGLSSVEIAKKLDITRITAYNHLQILLKNQLIRTEGNRKSLRYFPNVQKNFLTKKFSINEILTLKESIISEVLQRYDEEVLWEDIEAEFERYCMYIASNDTIYTGFEAFLLWCADEKHNFSQNIVEKAVEYLEIIASIESRRLKNGFLSGKMSAQENLKDHTKIGFNDFYFCMVSVLENGFGSTRTYLELGYGKKNGNILFLESAIRNFLDPIKRFMQNNSVDAYILTPPTLSRGVQFRDILEKKLSLKIAKIQANKVPLLGKVLREQKSFKGNQKAERIRNAFQSLKLDIPNELHSFEHIVIFDDTFTTGATPNAIAVRLREAGFEGKITIITICGSYNYELSLSEEEI